MDTVGGGAGIMGAAGLVDVGGGFGDGCAGAVELMVGGVGAAGMSQCGFKTSAYLAPASVGASF